MTDPNTAAEQVQEMLTDAGMDADERPFVDVLDGQKKSIVNQHEKRSNRIRAGDVDGNYGIYSGTKVGDGTLVDLDVDDYEVDDDDNPGMAALDDLPPTLVVQTPHTDGDLGGHKYVVVVPDDNHDSLNDAFTDLTGNKSAVNTSWGTVRIRNGYVVGPGSQITKHKYGCDKEWCDNCGKDDGGYYRIADDTPVATITVTEFIALLEADEKIGNDPTDTPDAGGSAEPAEDVDLEDDALWDLMFESKNGDSIHALYRGDTSAHNGDHSDSRFGLLSHLAFWTQCDPHQMDRMFRQSGLYPHPSKDGKWDRVGDTEIQKAIAGTDEVYSPGRAHLDPDEALDDLRVILNRYDDRDEDPSTDERYEIGRLLAAITQDDFENYQQMAATVLECEPWQVADHRDRQQYVNRTGTNIEATGGATWRYLGVPMGREKILNFEMNPKALLNVPDEGEQAKLELSTLRGQNLEKTVPTKIFHKKDSFKENILTEFGMEFDPVDGAEDELTNLNKYIASCDIPVLKGTRHMGLHGNEWVVPGGSLTPDGWTDTPQHYYLESDLAVERFVTLPRDTADYDRTEVAEILRELPKIRPHDRLLPALAWFYTAPFRPHILDMAGEFNLLSVTGESGSGKTSTMEYLWQLMGMKDDPLSPWQTKFTTMATLSSTHSIPLWFDEYKPSEHPTWADDGFRSFLRTATKGGVEQRGRQDQSTRAYHLHAPVAVSGEQHLRGTAVKRRSIRVNFAKKPTDESTSYFNAYKTLVGDAIFEDGSLEVPDDCPDPRQHALAYFQYVTSLDRETVKERWYDAMQRVHDYRVQWPDPLDLDDMEVQGLQTVVFGWMTFRDFAKRMGVDTADLPTDDDVHDAIRHVARNVGKNGRRKTDTDDFLELMSQAAREGYLEADDHYKVVKAGKPNEELRFRRAECHAAVSKYLKDFGLKDDRPLLGMDDYDTRIENYVHEETNTLWTNYNQNTPPIGRAAGILMGEADDRIPGFDPTAFGSESHEDADSGDATDGSTATPIKSITGRSGWDKTLTARVLTVNTDGSDNAPDVTGILEDDTGAVEYVCWEPMSEWDTEIDEDQAYRFKGVKFDDYDGTPQVELHSKVTTITPIQDGVGHAPGRDAEANQTLPTADGGEITDAKGKVREHLRLNFETGGTVRAAGIAAPCDLSPDEAESALDSLADTRLLVRTEDGYELT